MAFARKGFWVSFPKSIGFLFISILSFPNNVLTLRGFIFLFTPIYEPEGILEELKQNSKVKFKETDLFRMYQSIDLVSFLFPSIQDRFSTTLL